MIISRDLFIFGELFTTIGSNTINNVGATVPTTTTATTTTPAATIGATTTRAPTSLPLSITQQHHQCEEQPLSKLQVVDTLKAIAARSAITKPTTTTTTTPTTIVPTPSSVTTLSQQETVVVVVAAAAVAAAAAAVGRTTSRRPNLKYGDENYNNDDENYNNYNDYNNYEDDKRRVKDNFHRVEEFVEEERELDMELEPLMNMAKKKKAVIIAPVNGLNGFNVGLNGAANKPAKQHQHNQLNRLEQQQQQQQQPLLSPQMHGLDANRRDSIIANGECSYHLLSEKGVRDGSNDVEVDVEVDIGVAVPSAHTHTPITSASGSSSMSTTNSTSSTISVVAADTPVQGDPDLADATVLSRTPPPSNSSDVATETPRQPDNGSHNAENGQHARKKSTFPFIPEEHRTLQLTFQGITVLHNNRKILSDVSGLVSPGEVLAVMGPSGSGKTTLLDCLSGQRRFDGGNVHLNNEPLSKRWRRKIGYVLQEEVFFASLTLRETVMYTALLRLPETMPKSEKVKLVDAILETLELNFCQQTKFGDYLNRGLSGGEKKRANIACELLTNPLLMLLDEPTSGLDSHSALSLMKVLKRYAVQEQKTIVMSVHQPSSQMFHMFDKLLLLYEGRTAYFGEVQNIYRYFEDIGVSIKPHYNPADFILEQVKSYPEIREKLFVAAKESHCNFLNRNCIMIPYRDSQPNHHSILIHHENDGMCKLNKPPTATNGRCMNGDYNSTLINEFIHRYYKDVEKNNVVDEMLTNVHVNNDEMEASVHLWCGGDSQSNFSSCSSDCHQSHNDKHNHTNHNHNHHHQNHNNHHHHDHNDHNFHHHRHHRSSTHDDDGDWLDYPTGFYTQFRVLSCRNFKEAIPRMLSKLNWFQTIGLALMAGAIWYQIPRTEENLHDLQGWMFFSQTYWMLFALFGALNSFPSEREVISKERRSGAYRLSAYYLAKMFADLPLVVTLPTVYLMISYPMLGCTSFMLFLFMLVFLLLSTIVAQSVGFFIGACCMDMNVSITLSALYTLATQLFGGYLSSRIPPALSWVRYTSMIHYAYQNMQILEFREGQPISCGNPSSFEICKQSPVDVTSGVVTTTTSTAASISTFIPYEEILRAQNSSAPFWLNTLILFMFFLVFRGLGYAVLRYVRCPKT